MGDTLLYGHIQFSMLELRCMVHGMIASTRQDMLKNLLLLQLDGEGIVDPKTTPCPDIYWDQLVDNPANEQVGWSFMQDPRNQGATSVPDPAQWLMHRIRQEKPLREAFVDVEASRASMASGGAVVWSKKRIQAYCKAMQDAREALAAIVYMTGGAPPRGTELLTVRFQNDAQGNSRGIFIEDGLVVLVTTYHKNIAQTGNGKVVHRYLPREVGELVVWYLWFARPLWRRLVRVGWGRGEEEEEENAFMWRPQPEKRWQEPSRKRKRDGGQSTKRVGRSSRVRIVRAAARREEAGKGREGEEAGEGREGEDEEGGGEEGEGREAEGEEGEEGEEPPGNEDKPPSVELWNTNRLKLALQKPSLVYMAVKLTIMGWRHGSKSIWRRYIRNPKVHKAFMEGAESDSSGEEDDEAFDLQAGHSTSIAGKIYGRSLDEAQFGVESKRFAFRAASVEWHAFLQLPSAIEKKPGRGTAARAARKEALQEERGRWRKLRLVDLDRKLKQLLGPTAEFRSVQRPALEAIMQNEDHVVVIMGTGAGKSVLFMLPAMVSSGLTIVVEPLTALRFDMKARCDKLGITSAEWDSRRPYVMVQIMFVTPEAAVGEAFGHFINRERTVGRLDRFVLDECHTPLDSVKGFRPRLLALAELGKVGVQMVYLTATLRPQEEPQFIKLMGLPDKSQCSWFRGRTTRKNVGYSVHEYDREEEEKAIGALVKRLKARYPPPGQMVAYCATIARTVRTAEVLGAVCFHRNVGTKEEKQKIVQQLTSGEQ
jgi:hypothetical protein